MGVTRTSCAPGGPWGLALQMGTPTPEQRRDGRRAAADSSVCPSGSERDTNTPGPAPIGWRKQAQRGSATPQGHTESACLPAKEGLASAFLDSLPASSPALLPPL